jgi:hypothetical protein
MSQLMEEFSATVTADPVIQRLKDDLTTIIPELESIPVLEDDKSYTVNKNRIYLCIRDASGSYYSRDILTFVLVHEVAHVLCPDVGHTPLFKEIFNALLEKVVAAGMYNPSTVIPKDYCLF